MYWSGSLFNPVKQCEIRLIVDLPVNSHNDQSYINSLFTMTSSRMYLFSYMNINITKRNTSLTKLYMLERKKMVVGFLMHVKALRFGSGVKHGCFFVKNQNYVNCFMHNVWVCCLLETSMNDYKSQHCTKITVKLE